MTASGFAEDGGAMTRPLPAEAFRRPETYAGTRRPVDFASTLIPDAYVAPAFLELEHERIFRAGWIAVGTTAELRAPGDYLVAEVGGQSVIVCRQPDGGLRAFHNVCRHRGARLCDAGRGHADRFFQCPYHAWAYGLDGHCLGTPLFTADSEVPEDQRGIFDHSSLKAFDKTDHGLYPVHAAELGCLVLVCLAPEAPVLADVLGDLPRRFDGYRLDEWDLVTTREYVIGANWKLVGENFMEYYHLPWVHPGLVKVSPMKAHHRWQGRGMYVGFGTSPIATNADEGGWQGLPPISGLDGEQAVSARFVWLFPNVAVNVLPNHVVLLLVRPVTPTRTVETLYLLAHPESRTAPGAQAEIGQLLEFWDLVNREDVAIVERVQQGLANLAYTGGRLCYRFEEGVHRFQNLVVDHVLGEPRVPEGDAQDGQPMFAAG